MIKKPVAWGSEVGKRVLTRRTALALGAATATSLYLPGGFISTANAQTASFAYYIGPNGNDANPGTQSQPWAITALNTKRTTYAGKTVGLLDGTYGLITTMGQPAAGNNSQSGRLSIAGGTSISPTIVKAVNARQAIIDWQRSLQGGSGTSGNMQSSMQPGGDYVTIDGLVFDNNNYQCIVNNPGGGSGFNNLTVKNCLFRNQKYQYGSIGQNSCMVYSQGGSNILVTNCRFEGGSAQYDGDRHNALMFYAPTVNGVVEYCTFISEALGCDVIHFKQSGAKNCIIRNCYIDRSAVTQTDGGGFCIKWEGVTDTSDVASIYNNIIVSGGSTTRSIISSQPSTKGTWNIYNNTFVGPWTRDGGIKGIYDGGPGQFNCYQNIFHRVSGDGGQYGDVNVASVGTVGNMDRNHYTMPPKITVGDTVSTYSSLAAWRSASGKDGNSVSGSDPGFLLSGTEAAYYQLKSTSLLKTLGTSAAEIGGWRGASQVGAYFGVSTAKVPLAPQIIGVS